MEQVWHEDDGEVLIRGVRWNGRPRATGDLWVGAAGIDWRNGKATIRWREVEGFDVVRAGTWETEGGRSLYLRDADDPRTLDSDVVGALDVVAASRYRGARTHLIVETRRHVHVFTAGERVKRVRQELLPAIAYFAV